MLEVLLLPHCHFARIARHDVLFAHRRNLEEILVCCQVMNDGKVSIENRARRGGWSYVVDAMRNDV